MLIVGALTRQRLLRFKNRRSVKTSLKFKAFLEYMSFIGSR
jgi:hypothetical protein